MALFKRDQVQPAANEEWCRLVAVLFGLTTPIVIMTVLDPQRLVDNPSIFEVCMIGVCLACFITYVASVLFPGEVLHVWLDRENNVLELVCRGICSSAVNAIPLATIASVERLQLADGTRNGSGQQAIYMRLKGGRSIRLPSSMTKGEIDAINAELNAY